MPIGNPGLKDTIVIPVMLPLLTLLLAQLPDSSFAQRAEALVSRMTLEEKVSQMMHTAPAIARLGVPAYNWWNEALHGVARAGLATVFPQAIGLAATWNDSLLRRIAGVISDEARAKYYEARRRDQHGEYQGLTFWSPNVNLFRDPRWGRGQETYGEDPYLTGRMAVAFVRGMQGDDPRYLKTVATLKHFAVHSGPEPTRHEFDAVVDERDLRESYLPHFEAGVREGGAASVMCAYNRVYGAPACASDLLLGTILRGEWGFPGYVVTDCWAVDDIVERHKVAPDAVTAAASTVKAGADLECGPAYRGLVEAVHQGLVSEEAITRAVTRLFTARFRLGEFDPPALVPWSGYGMDVVDAPAHRALAREAARQSLVLLKNRGGILPLRKGGGTIAVIGPNADDPAVLLGNYNGTPSDPVTPLRGIREAVGEHAQVLWALGADAVDTAPATRRADSLRTEAVATARKADVVVMVLGLTPSLEGEELRLQVPGFRGGDRTGLDLPVVQEQLLEAVAGAGKPVVLILMNGGALAVNWAEAHVAAILEAWYPGQDGGRAIADVLFGDSSPGGRLPVTFYRNSADVPAFDDYAMKGRTYRFFAGRPLYPFGFGLSYTTFAYPSLEVDRREVGLLDTVRVTVGVKNTGPVVGDEVVQLYVSYPASAVPRPRRDLRGFRRVSLGPGERRSLTLALPVSTLRYWDVAQHAWVLEPGPVLIQVGASSEDIRRSVTVQVRSDRP